MPSQLTIRLAEQIQDLKKLKGEERGVDIKYLIDCVKREHGEKGAQKIQTELAGAGYDLPDISKISDMDWIKVTLPNIYMMAMVEVLGYDAESIKRLGAELMSYQSNLVKFFIKYLISPQKTIAKAVSTWSNHYTVGKLVLVDFNAKKRQTTVRLQGYRAYCLACRYHEGTFAKILEMSTGSKNVVAKETQCVCQGGPYHEFVFIWQ